MGTLRALIDRVMSAKMGSDLVWTFGSFVILALSGIAMNIIIALMRDAEALGVFNITYAVYLIASQVATLGIHYSVLRHAAYHQEEVDTRAVMLNSAIVMACVSGLLAAACLYFAAPWTTLLFGSEPVARAVAYAALGLALFPLNKVLISYINAMRHMRAFALLQSARYVVVLVVVAWFALSEGDFTRSTLAFFVAEALTSMAALIYLVRAQHVRIRAISRAWMTTHFTFGTKGMMGGLFLDLNTRLDVLLLGGMLNERAVGIYSFAAMLIDGVQHILAIVRVNFNPVLVKALRDNDHEAAMKLLRLSKRYVTLGTAVLSLCLLLGFWIAIEWIIPGKGLAEGWASLIILCVGFTLISGFVPFDNLPLVSGHPGYQTLQSACVTLVNVTLCIILTPLMGIEGAAIATVVGYMAGVGLLMAISPKCTGWHLLTNRFGT